MREVLAKRIIELAQRRTKEETELVEGALSFLTKNYRYQQSGPKKQAGEGR
jgi:hypothetical protein